MYLLTQESQLGTNRPQQVFIKTYGGTTGLFNAEQSFPPGTGGIFLHHLEIDLQGLDKFSLAFGQGQRFFGGLKLIALGF